MKKPTEVSKVETASEDMAQAEIERLSAIFPQFVKDGVVDFDAFREFFGEDGALAEAGQERYGLSWKGKSDAFKAIRVPATGTLTPQEEASKNWDTTANVFIEGDNLEALKLLQRHYRGKIKMIYIDPPYNTGKDFIYKDNFTENKSDYYERTGQTEGGVALTSNPTSAGRYHSDWLTMMYPRLFLARQLLRDDGVIFISIDDNEVANLRLIMDEIFGEENFVANFIWHSSTGGGIRGKFVNQSHQYILCYTRNILEAKTFWAPLSDNAKKQYDKTDENGLYREKDFAWKNSSWGTNQKYFIKCPDGEKVKPKEGYLFRFIEPTFTDALSKGLVVFKEGRNSPLVNEDGKQSRWNIYIKKYLGDGTGAPVSVIPRELVGINNEGTTETNEIFGLNIFENPKNIRLIKYLISLIEEDPDDLILDFFAGSGTSAHAVMAQNTEDGGNRKWISVQIPEETDVESEAHKAGYKIIAEISRERIRRAGDKIGQGDIGFKAYKLSQSNYRQWQTLGEDTTEEELKEQMKMFIDQPLMDGYSEKDVVYEIAIKEGFSLNCHVTPADVTKKLIAWSAIDGPRKLVVVFNKQLTEEDVTHLGLIKEAGDILVCLDSALTDSTKLNLARNFNLKVI
jgi:adenine-specific DNA-methyltransferase